MNASSQFRGRAVVLTTNTHIQPFDEHAKFAMFTDRSIHEWQKFACASAKLEFTTADTVQEAHTLLENAPAGLRILMLDRHYISEKALKDFIKAAGAAAHPISRLALSKNASVEYTRPLQSITQHGELLAHDIFYFTQTPPRSSSEDPEEWILNLGLEAQLVEVQKREIVVDVPLPTIGERASDVLKYPVTSTIVVSIEHWTHILWLNQLAFGLRWMELLRRKPLWGIWRALTAFSLSPDVILGRLVHKGKNTVIHKTAYVSGSIIEDGAHIGPHATVRNSYIAKGAHIQDHAVILNSVVGAGGLVLENTFLVSSMSYPGATIGNYKLQVSLIGRDAYINAWAGFVDAKFVGSVKVQHKGELLSTERSFLGSVIGHRAKVAAKILIHPGREIPNDTVVVMRPDEVVSVIPDDMPPNVPMVRDGGTLVPLGQERRAK
jgi:carbonic anhydrase/acetyltransferase-like protein (isoleucine patch superfamily)